MFAKPVCLKLRQSQNGQALVEYILILVVTITFIIVVSSRIMTPVSRFMKNYAGAYVECLLETGELPFIAAVSANTECDLGSLEKRDYNVADLNIGGGGGGGSSGGNNNNSSNQNNQGNNNNNSRSGNSGNGSGSGSGFGNNNSSPTNNSSGAMNESAFSSGSGAGGGGSSRGDKLASKANSASKAGGTGAGDAVPYQFQQDFGRGISGYIQAPKTEEQKQIEKMTSDKSAVKASKTGSETERLRAKNFTAPVPARKEKKAGIGEDFDLGFNFGKYMRYFMIGGIILALIIMVFTMLNNLRKNWGE